MHNTNFINKDLKLEIQSYLDKLFPLNRSITGRIIEKHFQY